MIFNDQSRINVSRTLNNTGIPKTIREVSKRIINLNKFTIGEISVILKRLNKLQPNTTLHLALGGMWAVCQIEKELREFKQCKRLKP